MLDELRDVFLDALSETFGAKRKDLIEKWNAACEDVYRTKEALLKEERCRAKARIAELEAQLAAHEQAEKDGLIVRLPCKVGDTVWTNISILGSYLRRKDRPYACKVLFVGLNDSDYGGYINVEFQKSGYQFPFDFDQLGRTVFLTQEAAEAALKEQECNDGK